MRLLAKVDLAVVVAALVVSLVLFDLFPGPVTILSLVIGGAGWLELRRGHLMGRRLLATFVGMVLPLAAALFVAFVVH
ncbi:MAG TPA: hypothetical protein VNH82_09570 [Candidatus Dormibacteraeota bacterium]|nr:hypothetical protein [Candidatus Dormibacteraeota bacterium]